MTEPTSRPALTGEARTQLRARLARDYKAGATLAELTATCDYSRGTIRKLLIEANVTLRPQGPARTSRFR